MNRQADSSKEHSVISSVDGLFFFKKKVYSLHLEYQVYK